MALQRRLHRVVPFSWSSPRPECGTVAGINLPPDVRFAGEALQKMRAPPWIAIYPNQPLTEKPSCEAGHMTASDFCAARYIFSCQATHELPWARRSRMDETGASLIPKDFRIEFLGRRRTLAR